MKRRRARAEFSPFISSKIAEAYLPKIDFRKSHRPASCGWLGFNVNMVNEHAQPLRSGAMHVHSAPGFASALDFDAFIACLGAVLGISAFDD